MSHRLDYYYRQKVTELELDQGFDYLEQADLAQNVDAALVGVCSGLTLVEQAVPDLTMQVAGGVGYDKLGRRLYLSSTQVVNLAVDFNSTTTTVSAPGNAKWVSVFLMFARALSDPRTDGNNIQVFFQRQESFSFKVVQSAEAPVPTRPAVDAQGILLADLLRVHGQTDFDDADVSTTRREVTFLCAGTPESIAAGTTKGAVQALLDMFNAHVDGSANTHPGADIAYNGGATWADGTTNPATTVELQLDKIVNDLRPTSGGSSGARKVGVEALSQTDGSTTVSSIAGTLKSVLDTVYTNLAQLREQWMKKDRTETISGAKTFTGDVNVKGNKVTVTHDDGTDGTIYVADSGVDYQLIHELYPGGSAASTRFYLDPSAGGGLRITYNAGFVDDNAGGGSWFRDDDAQQSLVFDVGLGGLIAYRIGTPGSSGIDLVAHEIGRLTLEVPQGTIGSPLRTVLQSEAFLYGPGEVTVRFAKRYVAAGADPAYEMAHYPKQFDVAPSSVTFSGSVTNVAGGTGGITFTSYVSGARVQWTPSGAGDTLVNGDVVAS